MEACQLCGFSFFLPPLVVFAMVLTGLNLVNLSTIDTLQQISVILLMILGFGVWGLDWCHLKVGRERLRRGSRSTTRTAIPR